MNIGHTTIKNSIVLSYINNLFLCIHHSNTFIRYLLQIIFELLRMT